MRRSTNRRVKDALLGYANPDAATREAVAVALAVAAARFEGQGGAGAAKSGERGSSMSPWVATHRARSLR